jgi:hypothetical protein
MEIGLQGRGHHGKYIDHPKQPRKKPAKHSRKHPSPHPSERTSPEVQFRLNHGIMDLQSAEANIHLNVISDAKTQETFAERRSRFKQTVDACQSIVLNKLYKSKSHRYVLYFRTNAFWPYAGGIWGGMTPASRAISNYTC